MKRYISFASFTILLIICIFFMMHKKHFSKKNMFVKVALIIDDMGNERKIAKELLKLPIVINFSFLPYGRYTNEISEKVIEKGGDVLLHLPMEPIDMSKNNPGKGAIYANMNKRKIIDVFYEDLLSVPFAGGLNNHMGSKITPNRDIMSIVLKEVKKNKLFFIDSLTTPGSCAYDLAVEMGIPALKRDIFIDYKVNYDVALTQLDKIIELGNKKKTL